MVSNLLYFHPWGRFPFWQTYFSTGWFNHQLDHRRCWPPARQKACLVPTAATAESLGLPGVVLTDKNHGMTDKTRWWFQIFIFSPLLGEMIQFDWYFSDGLKPPTRKLPSKNRRLKLQKILRCILRKAAILMCACMWGMKHLWRRRVFKKTRCALLFFSPYSSPFVFLSAFLFVSFFKRQGEAYVNHNGWNEKSWMYSHFLRPSKPWLWKNGDPHTFTQSGVRSSLPSLGERNGKNTHAKLSNTPHPSQTKKSQL